MCLRQVEQECSSRTELIIRIYLCSCCICTISWIVHQPCITWNLQKKIERNWTFNQQLVNTSYCCQIFLTALSLLEQGYTIPHFGQNNAVLQDIVSAGTKYYSKCYGFPATNMTNVVSWCGPREQATIH